MTPWAAAARLRAEAERAALSDSLAAFMKAAWSSLEPTKPLVWGWHIEAILAHCEAVARGEIRTLLVTIPPRHLKSTLIAVLFPAWLWTQDRSLKLLTGAYAMPLAIRDATKTRRLITSPWYRRMFPEVALEGDQGQKQRYDLIGGGARYCFSTAGIVTGEGADILIYDDPNKASDMYSEASLETTRDFWNETLPTRMDDPERGAKIVVMQRLGEKDLAGHIMREALAERDSNLVHVSLPVHFDPSRACATRWFRDPRTERGSLLWPERMNARALREITRSMSKAAIAAQMEQEPTAKGGSILKRQDWRIWLEPTLPRCEAMILSVDPSMKANQENDPWALTVWGAFEHHEPAGNISRHISRDSGTPGNGQKQWVPPGADGRDMWSVILLGSWEEYLGYPEAKAKLLRTVMDWTLQDVPPTAVLIEDKAAGPILIIELQRAGIMNVTPWPPKGYQFPDKIARAHLVSDLLENGRVWVPARKLPDGTRSSHALQPFAERVVAQCELFPAGEHDDLVDTATQAWWWLRDAGWAALDTDPDPAHEPVLKERRRESLYG